MSKKHSMPEMKEGGVNVTPLIDVVMCLIIFFMLVAKIGVSTGATPMSLPTTILGKKLDQIPDTVFLNVTDPNLDHENGLVKRENPADPTSPAVRLQTHFDRPEITASFDTTSGTGKAEKVELQTDRGGHPLRDQLKVIYDARKAQGKEKDFSVSVRAEADLPFSMLQQVLAEIAQVGIRNVNYGANEPGAGGAKPPASPG